MAKLSKRQTPKIDNKYTLARVDYNEIKKYNFNWEDKHLDDIKGRIRMFYKEQQNNICAFCKLPFRDDIHIEHMVPKGGKYGMPMYAFYTLNLCVCCKHCNSKKSTNNDMVPWNRIPYPHDGQYFKIIHPHFDNYFDHIQIVDKTRYVAKTLKGYKTINRCKLYDPVILEVLAETTKYQEDPLIQGVLRMRELGTNFKATIDRFFDKIFG
ncbi:MAG: hypothetical protein JST70_13705 [Bacteroidetes bacterium]|nr:hypothetical protein [Bacteroidota bacterium]